MSCYDLCPPKTSIAVPQPIAESCNELCAWQCPDSTALIQPPPIVITFPSPILSSFPQQAVVGSSGAPASGGSSACEGYVGSGRLSSYLYDSEAPLSYKYMSSALSMPGSGCCSPFSSHQ